MRAWILATLLAIAPLTPSEVTGYVRTGWERPPRGESTNERLRNLANALQANDVFHLVEAVDTDDDGLLDLIAVAAAPPDVPSRTGAVQLFRGADLQVGRYSPYLLAVGGTFRRLEQVADINQDGRTEVVITHGPSGSGAVIWWQIYQWEGSTYRLLFDALVDSWAGPNDLTITPGQISLTCRPMGVYDHHTYPHRQHKEFWRWDGKAYRMTSPEAPPPENQRQAVNDAEAFFRNQAYAKALPLYQRALQLPNQPDDPDWAPYVHFRLGQSHLLLGRRGEAAKELRLAAQAPGLLGQAAAATLAALSQPVATALAAPMGLPVLGMEPTPPSIFASSVADLAPPEVLLQAYLQAGGDWRRLQAAGIPVAEAVSADLDGDGRPELWVRMAAHRDNGYLAVRQSGEWRVGELSNWGERPTLRPVPESKRQVLHFWRPGEEPMKVTIGWDGRQVLTQSLSLHRTSLQPPPVPPCHQPIDWL